MKDSHTAVQMVLCSMEYSEDDYIRSYADFRVLCTPNTKVTKIVTGD